ncbi:hypothetical protein C823_005979 [Eubacterium plexicaudatum ASF492]|nr:hypothetical protein C823_005979 [Eubacterium plexicaudatum ASF492]
MVFLFFIETERFGAVILVRMQNQACILEI